MYLNSKFYTVLYLKGDKTDYTSLGSQIDGGRGSELLSPCVLFQKYSKWGGVPIIEFSCMIRLKSRVYSHSGKENRNHFRKNAGKIPPVLWKQLKLAVFEQLKNCYLAILFGYMGKKSVILYLKYDVVFSNNCPPP